jgi:uncharacterized protein (TIGR01777 family)
LVHALSNRGDEVTVLSRRPEQVTAAFGANVRALRWEPGTNSTSAAARPSWFAHLSGQDAIVHLAGEQAVGTRYTRETKRRIYDSRVESTFQIVEAIAEADPRPRVLICASGAGYYGGHLTDSSFDETSPVGNDFLATVTRDWEAAAERAADYRVRVVRTRFGIVLGRQGGGLAHMTTPFKMFVGGPIGSGRQIVSWVHVVDVVRVLLLALDNDSISGPINVTTPHAVTNDELSRTIGDVLGRPSWFRVPGFALKMMFGEGAVPILTGQRALPLVLQRAGFEWRYPEVRPALEEALAEG